MTTNLDATLPSLPREGVRFLRAYAGWMLMFDRAPESPPFNALNDLANDPDDPRSTLSRMRLR